MRQKIRFHGRVVAELSCDDLSGESRQALLGQHSHGIADPLAGIVDVRNLHRLPLQRQPWIVCQQAGALGPIAE